MFCPSSTYFFKRAFQLISQKSFLLRSSKRTSILMRALPLFPTKEEMEIIKEKPAPYPSEVFISEGVLKKLNLSGLSFFKIIPLSNLRDKNIRTLLKGVSGEYCIINIQKEMAYTGSAKNLERRLWEHLNPIHQDKLNKHSNIRLQRALAKDGREVFVVVVLKLVPRLEGEKDAAFGARLVAFEQVYLDLIPLECRYNFLTVAGSRLGSKHSEATIAKFRGIKVSAQKRARISAAKKGGLAPNRLAVKIINEKEGISFEASSFREAAGYLTALGVLTSLTTIGRYLRSGKLWKGWKVSSLLALPITSIPLLASELASKDGERKQKEEGKEDFLESTPLNSEATPILRKTRKAMSAESIAKRGATLLGRLSTNRTPVKIRNVKDGNFFEASSLKEGAAILTSRGIKTSLSTVSNYLKSSKLYKGCWKVEKIT